MNSIVLFFILIICFAGGYVLGCYFPYLNTSSYAPPSAPSASLGPANPTAASGASASVGAPASVGASSNISSGAQMVSQTPMMMAPADSNGLSPMIRSDIGTNLYPSDDSAVGVGSSSGSPITVTLRCGGAA